MKKREAHLAMEKIRTALKTPVRMEWPKMMKNGMKKSEVSSQLLVLIPLQSKLQTSGMFESSLDIHWTRSYIWKCSEKDEERHRQEIKEEKWRIWTNSVKLHLVMKMTWVILINFWLLKNLFCE